MFQLVLLNSHLFLCTSIKSEDKSLGLYACKNVRLPNMCPPLIYEERSVSDTQDVMMETELCDLVR